MKHYNCSELLAANSRIYFPVPTILHHHHLMIASTSLANHNNNKYEREKVAAKKL